jgi:serine/threonine protein kinase
VGGNASFVEPSADSKEARLVIGTTIAHYRITKLLGSGGMGDVYAAEDLELRRRVALKMLQAAVVHDTERRERFEREAHAVAALNHPNIVTIHSIERVGDRVFLSMELVNGRPLSKVIPARGFELNRLLDIAIPLADAVSAAHGAGIIHRDLKPGNVMLSDDGRVKVLDFGLARFYSLPNPLAPEETAVRDTPLTRAGSIMGTVAYMSPEQAEGRETDARSDIFSLGI